MDGALEFMAGPNGARVFAAIVAVVALTVVWRTIRSRRRESQLALARQNFHHQREHLEAKFYQIASNSGKPRGLEWVGVDFEDSVVYARDRSSGQLSAFVGVTIRFAAIAGEAMEGVEAVGNLKAATSVFRFEGGHWSKKGRWCTDGRAIFNLNPAEAVQFYQANLELVCQDSPHLAKMH
jgi:hypothetical protein